MAKHWTPPLRVCETDEGCRLWLGNYVYGDGATLQEAADDLVSCLLVVAMNVRSGTVRFSSALGRIDLRWFELVYELGEIAAAGGDIRARVFGGEPEFEAA